MAHKMSAKMSARPHWKTHTKETPGCKEPAAKAATWRLDGTSAG